MNEIINQLLSQMPSGISPMTESELLQSKINTLNSDWGNMKYYECPKCRNKGKVYYADGTAICARECECMPIRKSRARMQKSGLSAMESIYSMDRFKDDTEATAKLKKKAQWFLQERGKWFFISGQSGGGKTHICSAMCFELISAGKDVYYMIWRDMAPRLKALVNDRSEYDRIMWELKTVDVLYIDDFLKGSYTDADINLAFELINHRYLDSTKTTIISTERSMEEIMSIDEALGGRIYERARGYCVKAPTENRRLKNGI